MKSVISNFRVGRAVAVVGGASLSLAVASASAAIIDTTNSSADSTAYYGSVSATDLINNGQATLTSATSSNGGSFGFSSANITDGTGAAGAFFYTGTTVNGSSELPPFPETSTYVLNTNASTGGSATGYSLTNVNVFAGYGGTSNALGNQIFDLEYSTVAAPTTFVNLGTFSYTPQAAGGTGATEQLISDNTGPIAFGVAAVQFVFHDPQTAGPGNSGTLIQEADVIGAPTVAAPEPSAAYLAAFGFAALGLVRRRRLSSSQ